MNETLTTAGISRGRAVLTIAMAAAIWGVGFPMTRIALSSGISVGALMSIRFAIAGVLMFLIIRARRVAIHRRGVMDGIWLGVVLAAIFWLQTDGMRFTSTAKSGFITGLYVLFTPLVAVVAGQRVKPASALAAVIATYGLYLLVHIPGGLWAGWNRGDVETLLCAFLCGIHMVMMGAFTRRSDSWLLAGSQVIACGVISLLLMPLLQLRSSSHNGVQGALPWPALAATLYLAVFSTVIAFWAQASAQTKLGPTESAVLFCIEPVLAAVLSVYWLREPMTARQVAGGALMVLAMIVAGALPYVFRVLAVPDTRP
jgi:drug/metabolite transporter (DMT)-like permease